MKQCIQLSCLLSAVLILCACGTKSIQDSSESAPAVQQAYEERDIRIYLTADAELNLYNDIPHTLFVCIYQLSDLNRFDLLSGDLDGLYEILECSSFDSSIKSTKRLFLNPGEKITIFMDRVAETEFVAVVAGYSSLEKEKIIRCFDIPMVAEKTGAFSRTKTTKPGRLDIELALGTQQIDTPSQALRKIHEQAQETIPENRKADRGSDKSREEDDKTVRETIDEVKAAAQEAKETAETVQKTGETIQRTQKPSKSIPKTTIPKGW